MIIYNLTFIFYGFLAIVSQLIIFRELSIVFYGNELFIGTALSAWLFWVGVGSSKKFFSRNFPYLLVLAAVLLPLEIISIRVAKSFFYFGTILGPLPMFATTFISLSLYCILLGNMFPLACSLANEKGEKAALKKVYYLECLGSVLGGALFTYLFVGRIPVFYLAIILSMLTLFMAVVMLLKNKAKIGLPVAVAVLCVLIFAFFAKNIQTSSRKIEWGKFKLLEETESRYAHLALARMGSLKLFFENGLLSAQFPLATFYEEGVHWPMLLSSAPKNILVVGNAESGTLREVFKYSIERLDYVQLDEKSTALLKPYLEKEDAAALSDARLFIHYADARFWLKNHPRQYDVVILNVPEPANAQANRFYTQEFYQELKQRLKPDGVLAFSLPSAAEYLRLDIQVFNTSIYKTFRSVLASVDFVPGDNLLFLAGPEPINLNEQRLVK
ncbi:MAG: hypothetical protein PHU91_02530, partial [Candidatus Omnitrophica bacterium]|nr:hypothetical protein [Candidatus Omnitrophota bacterium]